MAQAIDSALAQTYPNIEILIINDGSDDGGESESIALSYGSRIKYYRKENGGVSSALNYAFTKMCGEWFSWLSHDDLYLPDKILRQVEYLNKLTETHPEIDITKITVRTVTKSIDKNSKTIKVPFYGDVPEIEEPLDTILNNVFNYRLSGCSFLLPRSCVSDVGGFREDIRTVSDVEYWYRLLFFGYRFHCLKNERLVLNRSHGKQVGKTKVQLFTSELNDLFINIADRLAADKLAAEKKYIEYRYFEKYYMALVKRNCKPAYKYVKMNYLKNNAGFIRYYVIIPIRASFYKISGFLRNIARTVYRKINVK